MCMHACCLICLAQEMAGTHGTSIANSTYNDTWSACMVCDREKATNAVKTWHFHSRTAPCKRSLFLVMTLDLHAWSVTCLAHKIWLPIQGIQCANTNCFLVREALFRACTAAGNNEWPCICVHDESCLGNIINHTWHFHNSALLDFTVYVAATKRVWQEIVVIQL